MAESLGIRPITDYFPDYNPANLDIPSDSTNGWGGSKPGQNAGSKHPLWGKTHSKETKKKMSQSHAGVPKGPHSSSTKALMREKALEREKLGCPHCGKEVPVNVAKRWHFDNCKLLKA